MSLIEKIDAEIAKYERNLAEAKLIKSQGGIMMFAEKLAQVKKWKEELLSEQKEPCGWCSKWRLEFNAIDDEGNTITTDGHMVMGGIADYCPVCGRYLNEPQEGE